MSTQAKIAQVAAMALAAKIPSLLNDMNNKRIKNKKKANKAKRLNSSPSVNSNNNNRKKLGNNAGTATSFSRALSDPFDPSVLGCQVPDPFPFPTAVHHIHQTTVMGTDALNTAGSLVFLPNPVLSLIDTHHVAAPLQKSVVSTPMAQYSATFADQRSAYYGATTPANISAIYESYRVVSWGLKISNLQPELTATGRIIIAFVPAGGSVPSYTALFSIVNQTASAIIPVTGVPANIYDSSNMLQFPTAVEFAVQDLLHGGIEISGMYTNSSFWSFKVCALNGALSATQTEGDDAVVTTGTQLVPFVGFKDLTRMDGGCSISLYYEGVPINTSAFQIETIYHLEGTPVIGTGASATPVPSSLPKSLIGSTASVEKAMSNHTGVDKCLNFITRGAQFLNTNASDIMSASSLLRRR